MKRNKKIIGITGNIASGKSTVVNYLLDKGYKVVDADEISHQITNVGEEGYRAICEHFGDEILLEDKNINRKKLGEIVFGNPNKLKVLSEMLHPIIRRNMLKKIQKYLENTQIVFVDVPLLFEGEKELRESGIVFDEIWLVHVEKSIQLERLIERDGIDTDLAMKKINSQMSSVKKRDKADIVIFNNDSKNELFERINSEIDNLELRLKLK